MPDSDMSKGPTSPAGGPRCWDTGEKAPGNERPQRRTPAPGLAGGVGVYWGERSPSWLLPSFSSLRDPSHCSSGCTRPRLAKAPPSPAPAPCVAMCPPSSGAGGVSESGRRLPAAGLLQGSWPEASVASPRCSPKCLESPEKPGLTVPCLFFFLPGWRQELGTAEPRLHLSGVTRTRCSARPAPFETPGPRRRRRRRPRLRSSPRCPALFGPRANLGSGRATLARLGFEHLLLSSLAPRLREGGAAAASVVRSRRRGADARGSSSLHFNSWPLWPLHTEREDACRSRPGGGCDAQMCRVARAGGREVE